MEEEKFTEKTDSYINTRPSLLNLFFVFAKIGLMTFGGGMAMLPILHRELVESRHWATSEELTNYYAIAMCTPGIIAVNTATFVGHRKRGTIGGIMATLGVVFPSIVIICALAKVISLFSDNLYVQKAFFGIRACVCVLILNAIIKLWKGAVKGRVTLIVFMAALAISILFDISPIIIVVGGIIAGIICALKNVKLKGALDD